MEKNLITFLILLSNTCFIYAAPDCMDTSNNLQKKVDYKELHYVACNHNCYQDPHAHLVENRGTCSICGHYHLPRPLVMVKTASPSTFPTPIRKNKTKSPLAKLFAPKNR